MIENGFHKKLHFLITSYILVGYKTTKQFPDDERFGMISQARRALVSILLNYVEGYARSKKAVMINFYEISYGSLQETICVFYLATQLKYIAKEQYQKLFNQKEEIAKMIWKTVEGLKADSANKK